MSKIDHIRHRLCTDPDACIGWLDGGYLPNAFYETAEVTGIQLSLMLDQHEEVYVLLVLPGDEYGTYDAWLRRMGSDDMVHMLSKRVRDPEDAIVAALENLPDYIDLV